MAAINLAAPSPDILHEDDDDDGFDGTKTSWSHHLISRPNPKPIPLTPPLLFSNPPPPLIPLPFPPTSKVASSCLDNNSRTAPDHVAYSPNSCTPSTSSSSSPHLHLLGYHSKLKSVVGTRHGNDHLRLSAPARFLRRILIST